MNKKCPNCKTIKPLTSFSRCSTRKDGVQCWCKQCSLVASKKWAEENHDRILAINKKHRENNRQKVREQKKKWQKNNKEKTDAQTKKWRARNPERAKEIARESYYRRRPIKRDKSPKARIGASLSNSINRSLIRGVKGRSHWENLVDFTFEQLRMHLEKLFKPGMTWENYGTYWHIDHKIPKAIFNFENPDDIDFRLCWSIKNLQPLEATENKRKHVKIAKPFQPSLLIGVG